MKNNGFKRIFIFVKPYRTRLVLAMLALALSALCMSLSPLVLGKATDALIHLANAKDNIALQGFIKILILLASLYLLYVALRYTSSLLLAYVSQNALFSMRQAIDKKFKKLPIYYVDKQQVGDILSKITNDVDMVANSFQQIIEIIAVSIISALLMLGIMLYISPLLTLIALLTLPLSFVVSMKIGSKSHKHFMAQQNTLGVITGFTEENYSGHNIVTAFGAEEQCIAQFKKHNNTLYESAWKAGLLSFLIMPATQFFSFLGYIVVIIISGHSVMQGAMSIGIMQAFIQYLRHFNGPIIATTQMMSILQATSAASQRVFDFLDETEEIDDSTNLALPETGNTSVVFENVQFGYNESLLMHNVNFNIPSGTKVAIVGPTGAGKTTLVNLLLRFYDVKTGKILVGGTNINEMQRKELRKMFAMVLQDTWLFEGSILENIRYGKLDATDEQVHKAAKAARADAFIQALPNGYSFQLQEGGANLAQGERQLLTIARAILSDAPIMILDEATSSVDTRTEVLIQEAMKKLMKGRTSFIIAHRLSTIIDADTILYMENGDIKEIGTHSELLHKNGAYAKMYNSQFA